MDHKIRADICKHCSNRKYDLSQGLICSLDGLKPFFEKECTRYSEDFLIISETRKEEIQEIVRLAKAKGLIRVVNYLIDIFLIYLLNIGIRIALVFSGIYIDSVGIAYLILYSILITYFLFFESVFGQTIGKMITGTKVVRYNGLEVGFGVVVGRTFARLIPFEPFSFLGSEARGWHDSLTDTFVVRKKEFPVQSDADILDDL